jgi:biofilm PGA synthesis protein PgaA
MSKNATAIILILTSFAFLPSLLPAAATGKAGADLKGAHETYQQAVALARAGDLDSALPLFEEALAGIPDNIYLKADYIICLVWHGDYEKAVRFYAGEDAKLAPVTYLPGLVARAFYETARYDQAVRLYKKALIHDKGDREAFRGLVYSHCRLGEFNRANALLLEYRGIFEDLFLLSLKAQLYLCADQCGKAYYLLTRLLGKKSLRPGLLNEIQEDRRAALACFKAGEAESLIEGLEKTGVENPKDRMVHILTLVDLARYGEALDLFQASDIQLETLSPLYLSEIAWAYFKTEQFDRSIALYERVAARHPHRARGHIGLVYNYGALGRMNDARRLLAKAAAQEADEIDLLFARAFLFEKEGRFIEAIAVYDRILSVHFENRAARILKVIAYADLGARTHAVELAGKLGIDEGPVKENLTGDTAVDRIEWGEPEEAIRILKDQLARDPGNHRARSDLIIALRENEDMGLVLEQFEILKAQGAVIPYWIARCAADAFLDLEKPHDALTYYLMALEEKPDDFKSAMGLFYTYQVLRDWKSGERTWEKIEDLLSGTGVDPWDRLEALGARGWYLADRDELKEAQHYFESYRERAGLNSSFRTGLGHVFLWRGWPRRALEELKIAETLDPEDIEARNGVIATLNILNYKKEARELSEAHYRKHFKNRHTEKLRDDLKLEDRIELWTDFSATREDPGATEYWFNARLTEPLTPRFRLYQETVWKTSAYEGEDVYWRRIGLGARWIVHPELVWDQAASFDYMEKGLGGYRTELQWFPNDHLRLSFLYDGFSLDIPFRARITGITAQTGKLGFGYHWHENRHMGIWTTVNWYDDDNTNYGLRALLNQGLLNTPSFKIRGQLEVWYGGNEKTDVDYFSPRREFHPALTGIIHWWHYNRYDRAYRSHIYITVGPYKQSGFDYMTAGHATFEQLIDLTRRSALMWNISWHYRIYDGEPTKVWSGYVALRQKF